MEDFKDDLPQSRTTNDCKSGEVAGEDDKIKATKSMSLLYEIPLAVVFKDARRVGVAAIIQLPCLVSRWFGRSQSC